MTNSKMIFKMMKHMDLVGRILILTTRMLVSCILNWTKYLQ